MFRGKFNREDYKQLLYIIPIYLSWKQYSRGGKKKKIINTEKLEEVFPKTVRVFGGFSQFPCKRQENSPYKN